MLKVLTRLLRPDRGVVGLRGRVGALIEVGSGFHLDLTGRENVFLNGTILGMRRQEVERRLDAIVEFAGIGPFIDTPVKRYSSGMAARLGFAVAAHLEPDVLIVDEVLSVGDFTFQGRCIQWMHEVLRNGTTVIFVSHNMDSVLSLCDRALLLNHGEVKYLGRPDEAVARYYAAGGTWTPVMAPRSKATTVSFAVDGLPERGTVEPGTRLHCVQRIEATAACVVSPGIIVSKDSNVLMTTTVGRLAGEPISLDAGERREVHWDFTVNLPAGAYDLGHHVESVSAGESTFYDYDARARVMVVADRPGVHSTHFLDVAVGVMQAA
jgi:lipopolysaccharide transport system ATP-binding protein